MKYILTCILLCLLFQQADAQKGYSFSWRYRWVVHPAMTGISDVKGAVLDSLGNYIAVGVIRGSGNFDTKGGSDILSMPGSDLTSAFIWKVDTAGKSIWAKQLSTVRNSEAWDVETDKSGDLFVSGEFTGDFDADPGPNVLTFNSDTSGKGHFIIKLDPNGDLIWARNLPGHVRPTRLAMDPNGRLVIGGSFSSSVDVDPGPATHILDSPVPGPWENMLAMVWDADGNFIWASGAGGNQESIVSGICADHNGNILATGSFGGVADFDPGPGQFTVNGKQKNGFVWKLDRDGKFVWSAPLLAETFETEVSGAAIVADPSGDPIVIGSYTGHPDIDPGPGVHTLGGHGDKDIFVVKLNSNGQLVWAGDIGGEMKDVPYDLALDYEGNIAITGSFTWGIDLDPDIREQNGVSAGDRSLAIFLDLIDPNGGFLYAMVEGSIDGGDDAGTCILTQGDFFFLAGRFGHTGSMWAPTFLNTDHKSSLSDIFLQKIRLCKFATTEELTITSCGPYTINDSTYTSSGKYVQKLVNAVGCDSLLTIKITVKPKPDLSLGADRYFCAGGDMQLDPGQFVSYLWQDGTSDRTMKVSGAGTFSVTVTDTAGCSASDTLVVTGVVPAPSGFLPAGAAICPFDHLVIQPTKTFQQFAWSNGSSASSLDIVRAGLYWLEATDANGCTGRDSILISEKSDCPTGFHVPNAFTPNGDGLNDGFKPIVGGALDSYSFRVFDRWGELVFFTTDRNASWDGTRKGEKMPTGTFSWVCSFVLNGEPKRTEKGTVVLIR